MRYVIYFSENFFFNFLIKELDNIKYSDTFNTPDFIKNNNISVNVRTVGQNKYMGRQKENYDFGETLLNN